MKKNISVFSILMLTLIFTFEGCKKGENDPGLSLKSRKGRLAGEWNVTSLKNTSTNSGTSFTSTITTELESGNWTYSSESVISGSTSSISQTGTGDIKITFEKDGTFSSIWNQNWTSYTNSAGTSSISETMVIEFSGTWMFLGKNKDQDIKNKEQIALHTLSETYTYTDTSGSSTDSYTYAHGESVEIWNLDRLAGKELEVSSETNNSTNTTNSSGSSTSSTVGELVFKAEAL